MERVVIRYAGGGYDSPTGAIRIWANSVDMDYITFEHNRVNAAELLGLNFGSRSLTSTSVSRLVESAPEQGSPPRIDLPDPAATSELRIEWQPALAASVDTGERTIAALTSLGGSLVLYPEPVRLVASLTHDGAPVTGAGVKATISDPLHREYPLAFRDDGIAPDLLAGDGLYSAVWNPDLDGEHRITIQFDNQAGIARQTWAGLLPSVGVGGQDVPMPPEQPVGEAFWAFDTLLVQVAGIQPDDHQDTPDHSTFILSDNRLYPGKIDHVGDRDLFYLPTPEFGPFSVRLTRLGFGIQPRLRLLASDGQTAVAEGTLSTSSACDGNLVITLPWVNQGQRITYAEVTDVNEGASGGVYALSAGDPLAGDLPCHSPGPDVFSVFLPFTRR